jgi:hypothetical protein
MAASDAKDAGSQVRLLQWNVLAQNLTRSPALEFVPHGKRDIAVF